MLVVVQMIEMIVCYCMVVLLLMLWPTICRSVTIVTVCVAITIIIIVTSRCFAPFKIGICFHKLLLQMSR